MKFELKDPTDKTRTSIVLEKETEERVVGETTLEQLEQEQEAAAKRKQELDMVLDALALKISEIKKLGVK